MKHSTTPLKRTAFLIAALLFMFGLRSQPALAQDSAAKYPPDPNALLRAARIIYVRSSSLLVRPPVIESKLRKRSEFQKLGLVITRDPTEADLVLEVRHDLFTKYVFSAIDTKTNIVVASGKLSSLGGTVAGKVAKRFMKQVMRARSQPGP